MGEPERAETPYKETTMTEGLRPEKTVTDGGYHWRDGWHFLREPNGDVRILQEGSTRIAPEPYPLYEVARIPFEEWVSIVHATAVPDADFHQLRQMIGGGDGYL